MGGGTTEGKMLNEYGTYSKKFGSPTAYTIILTILYCTSCCDVCSKTCFRVCERHGLVTDATSVAAVRQILGHGDMSVGPMTSSLF